MLRAVLPASFVVLLIASCEVDGESLFEDGEEAPPDDRCDTGVDCNTCAYCSITLGACREIYWRLIADAHFDDYVACRSQCLDLACIGVCDEASPGAGDAYHDLEHCFSCDACNVACGGPPGC